MAKLTFFGGVDEIGGNKILLENKSAPAGIGPAGKPSKG